MSLLKLISKIFKRNTSTDKVFQTDEETKKKNWEIKYNDLGIFSYNSLGFEIDLKSGYHSIKWIDIERLQAYKVDLLTTDEICIDITFNNKTIVITEETKGWYQFIEKFKLSLPFLNDNWETLVLETPFEYNLTTIYERNDRKIPSKSNFFSVIENKSKEELTYLFQNNGWSIHKSSMSNYQFENSWADLVLNNDKEGLLLHGLMAYHPENVKIIKEIFDNLNCPYKFEFYNEYNEIVEQAKKDM
jgi:hypothetical protein